MGNTVVRQLLDRINQLKLTCDSADSIWFADMLIRDIEQGSKFDESFLEMEKEQMKEVAWYFREVDMKKSNKGNIIDLEFNEYYNETYGKDQPQK
jgi:hypothetical protein